MYVVLFVWMSVGVMMFFVCGAFLCVVSFFFVVLFRFRLMFCDVMMLGMCFLILCFFPWSMFRACVPNVLIMCSSNSGASFEWILIIGMKVVVLLKRNLYTRRFCFPRICIAFVFVFLVLFCEWSRIA